METPKRLRKNKRKRELKNKRKWKIIRKIEKNWNRIRKIDWEIENDFIIKWTWRIKIIIKKLESKFKLNKQ